MSINNCNDNNSSGDILKELKVSELKPHNNNNSYLLILIGRSKSEITQLIDFETFDLINIYRLIMCVTRRQSNLRNNNVFTIDSFIRI
ncbi:hypothetical protein GLOIN_2v1774508 [Rhizophagus irregularis DAOM 181602=DAOM 197198]|nr:hypothetical protein GLOIN_2v1774508 [Rhizophagus irregularis DAOM 181602=DAOM 197198]